MRLFLVLIAALASVGSQCAYAGRPTEAHLNEAADCPYVKLDDPGGPMAQVPVFDQGSGDNCWAHAGATVLTTLLDVNNPVPDGWSSGAAVSPTDMTFQEILSREAKGKLVASYIEVDHKVKKKQGCATDPNPIEDSDGDVCDEITAEQIRGECGENATFKMTFTHQFDVDFLKMLRGDLAKLRTLSPGDDYEQQLSLTIISAQAASSLQGQDLMTAVSTSKDRLRQINSDPQANDVEKDMQSIAAMLDLACAPRIKSPTLPACSHHGIDSAWESVDQEGKRKIISASLTGPRPMPIAIGYCANILTDDLKYVGVFADKSGNVSEPCTCQGHESVLIGQRWNAHPEVGAPRCEYLIRNSWGMDCDTYLKGLECDSGNEGDVWVDAKSLLKNTDDLTTFTN